jgi:hypothetical protein
MMQEDESSVLLGFDPDESPGQRPYEVEWANPKESRVPAVTFADLHGWRMETEDGAAATFRPSRSQNIWNRPVGKLSYRGNGDPKSQPRVLLSPPAPIRIPEGSDCVEMWLYGNRWDWENPPDTPPVNILLHLRDGAGKVHRHQVDKVRWKEWWLLHRKLPTRAKDLHFVSLEVEGGWQPEGRALFFDSITFYAESLQALQFERRPRRNLILFEGQSPGLNTGDGQLDFPNREETILPINMSQSFETEAGRDGSEFSFHYKGGDCDLVYLFAPAEGLSGIRASVNGIEMGHPLFGGGVKFLDGGGEGGLVRAELQGDVVTATYERGVAYHLRLWQKSLVIDASWSDLGQGTVATELSFGEARGVSEPATIYIPFITYGSGNPVVLRFRTGAIPCFASIWLDWYRSNGSEPYAYPDGEVTPTGVRINGGIRYNPRTDGKRNAVFERIFLTVSPAFEEVLPVIPNPMGSNAKIAIDRLWQETWGPQDYGREMERSRKLRAYGIIKLIQCNHEIAWRDGGESFTLRTRAAPGKGGDEALQDYLAHQKSLGWFVGLYTNYCDFAPVNEHWDPDYAQRMSDGNWRPAWPRCWALKPTAAVALEERLAPVIKGKYHPDGKRVSAYTDVHTAVAPWAYCDYDSRVPGAGTFAQTFYCYGELLRNDSRTYGGPIFSEGTYQWLYAGLADGNYALTYNGRPLAREPLLPVFFLREIHPKECDIGLGWTDWFVHGSLDPQHGTPDGQKVDAGIDRFLLNTIAYGTIGWLVEEKFGMERVCRSYYMLQRLQARYGLLPPAEMAYWDGRRNVGISQALADDLPRQRRQLFVAYPNGLKIWMNDWTGDEGGSEASWEVEANGSRYELPPSGWLAVQGEFIEFSATIDGHRVDFLRDMGWGDEGPIIYMDGRGNLTKLGEVASKGALAVKRLPKGQVEVIDISQEEFGLNHPFGMQGQPIACEVFDLAGKPLGSADIRVAPDYAWIGPSPEGHRYVVSFDKH